MARVRGSTAAANALRKKPETLWSVRESDGAWLAFDEATRQKAIDVAVRVLKNREREGRAKVNAPPYIIYANTPVAVLEYETKVTIAETPL